MTFHLLAQAAEGSPSGLILAIVGLFCGLTLGIVNWKIENAGAEKLMAAAGICAVSGLVWFNSGGAGRAEKGMELILTVALVASTLLTMWRITRRQAPRNGDDG